MSTSFVTNVKSILIRGVIPKGLYCLFVLLILSCAPYSLEPPANPPAGPYTYGPPGNVDFQLSSYEAGAEAAHILSFDIKQGDLQTYRVVIHYSQPCQGFDFKGFLALGPPDTQIGEYSIDFDLDGQPDFSVPLRSVDKDKAYADIDHDGIFIDGIDIPISHSSPSSLNRAHSFWTDLYWGGDGNAGLQGVFSGRVTVVMYAGILTNPQFGGEYEVHASLISVDPDTGDLDNGMGESPLSISDSRTITIIGQPAPLMIIGIHSSTPAWKDITYIANLQACSGIPPYTWEIINGGLPPGLVMDSAGYISGRPAETGSFAFTVRVTDAGSSTATKELGITVSEVPNSGFPKIDVGGGGCFIATAAYGSALHPHVNALRQFRDNHLKQTEVGRAFISLYERLSPPFAAVIAKHETLRFATRLVLAPLVYAVVCPKAYGICTGLLLAGFCAAFMRHRAKRR